MNRTIAISTVLTCALTVTSCSSIRQSDAFTDFLRRNSLQVRIFDDRTNEWGYEASIQLVGTHDTNRVLNGGLYLEEASKKAAELEDADIARKERERKEREDIRTATNLYLRVISGRRMEGWITDAHVLDSRRLRERFPGCRFFSVGCLSGTGNPVFIAQPLVFATNASDIAMSTVFVLGNAPTVATFITQHKRAIHSLEDARAEVDLLAELQNWRICTEMPSEVSRWEEAANPDWVSKWAYREKATESGWEFSAVFLTDPFIQRYSQYEVQVLPDGTITVKEETYMGSSGGYL